MRAFWYEKAGDAADVLELGETPDSEPGAGEVRVRVAVSAVNPTDAKRRQLGRELHQFPRIIPNHAGAGVIDRVGPGVPESRIGERVWVFGAQAGRPFGTAAEYVLLPSRQAIRLPEGTGFDAGACLGVPAVTAHHAVFVDGPVTGTTVLVTGAAGRCGRYAVQFARWAGATVIATVGSAEKAAHVKALGADHVLDYTTDDMVAEIKSLTDGAGVDRVAETEFGANLGISAQIVKPGGVIVTYGSDRQPEPVMPFYALMYGNIVMRPFTIYGMGADAQDLAFADITTCLAGGVLRHLVGRRFAFENMVAAHQSLENGSVFGSPLVDVGGAR